MHVPKNPPLALFITFVLPFVRNRKKTNSTFILFIVVSHSLVKKIIKIVDEFQSILRIERIYLKCAQIITKSSLGNLYKRALNKFNYAN